MKKLVLLGAVLLSSPLWSDGQNALAAQNPMMPPATVVQQPAAAQPAIPPVPSAMLPPAQTVQQPVAPQPVSPQAPATVQQPAIPPVPSAMLPPAPQPAANPMMPQQTVQQPAMPAAPAAVPAPAPRPAAPPAPALAAFGRSFAALPDSQLGTLGYSEDVRVYYTPGTTLPEKVYVLVREQFASADLRDEALRYEGTAAGSGLDCETVVTFTPATRSMQIGERRLEGQPLKVDKAVELHPMHRYMRVFAAVMDRLCQKEETALLDSLARYSLMYNQPGDGAIVPVYFDTATMYLHKPNELVYWQVVGNPVLSPDKVKLVKKLLLLDTLQEVTLTERSWADAHGGNPANTPGALREDGTCQGTPVAAPAGSEEAKGLMRVRFYAQENRAALGRYGGI